MSKRLQGSSVFSPIKIALPKGRFLSATACFLREAGIEFARYSEESRIYRLQSPEHPFVSAKVFQEKDIPVQVSIGNYDLGICGLDWIEELVSKYPSSPLLKLLDLGYGRGGIYVTSSKFGEISDFQRLLNQCHTIRIVTEYPNLAETMALRFRLRKFKIFPVWGAAEVYPPENAEIALLWAESEAEIVAQNLLPLTNVLQTSAFLVANKISWEAKDLSWIVDIFSGALVRRSKPWLKIRLGAKKTVNGFRPSVQSGNIWLALPDGHQQTPTLEFLNRVGFKLKGYSSDVLDRRPWCAIDWLRVKVIRPQDMPLQVANGNFDLAITGVDWFLDHVYRFPSSPVVKLFDLDFGRVKVVAVTSQDLPVDDIAGLRRLVGSKKLLTLRVASEYVNIADKYLRDNHFSGYRLIPTWGASEAFLPEDADLLIENTQTGRTLAEHGLKIVDTLFESTACVIGNKDSLKDPLKKEKISELVKVFSRAVGVK